MKAAGLLFVIASVFFASNEAEAGRLVESGIVDNSTESILGTVLDEIRQIHATLNQRSQKLNADRAAFQEKSSQCNILPTQLQNGITMYFLCETQLNWHLAYKYCKNYGMSLAVVDSEIIFRSLVHELSNYADQRGIRNVGFWIAGTDLGKNGDWYWESNGQRIQWRKWLSGQPDNGGENENCLEIRKYPKEHRFFNESLPYGFNDQKCQVKTRFICEFN